MELFETDRNIKALYQAKLAKSMFEAINTIWFVCLKIFISNKDIQINDTLYNYAFEKVFNME